MTKKLVYVANVRLPTENAHGYQIMKMCEAFAGQGWSVKLWHPRRQQPDETLASGDAFAYYGVPKSFDVESLPNIDVVRAERFLPQRPFELAFAAHAHLWARFAAGRARGERADLHYTRDLALAYWLSKRGAPTVYEVHAPPERTGQRILRALNRRRSLRGFVAVTSHLAERIVSLGVPRDMVTIEPDAVDLSMYRDLPSKRQCRLTLGLPTDRPIIGYVGRFRAMGGEKGIPELVVAASGIRLVDGKRPLLLCVGGPMDRVAAYRALAERSGGAEGSFRFEDRVRPTEVPTWIRACDVAVIPWPWTDFSAHYTSPLKLFEYMAAGTPIVATDLPSLRDVLSNRENALLVEPGDPISLAAGIRWVLENQPEAELLASKARADVAAYTWSSRAERILHRYRYAASVTT